MRVLMLNYEFPPLGGGAAHATRCLLDRFGGNPEVEVELVTSAVGPARAEQPAPNVRVEFLDIGKREGLHYQSSRDLLAYSWRALRRARTMARGGGYDLCHAFFGIPCGVIAAGLGLPYIVSLRGSDVPFYSERFRGLDRLLFRALSVRVWKGAEFVVANSAGLRDLALRSAPQQPIEVIPNGVDTEQFRPGDAPEGALKVLCVARLIRRKRVDLLLRALAELRGEEVRLTLVGSGDRMEHLRELSRRLGVGERVRFRGRVPHEELPEIYRAHDVFVLPSENEGMSNTALEALASGLPLVMTPTGGAEELLEEGRNGFFMPKGSGASLASILRRYLARPQLLSRQGARSREIAEGMSWAAVANRYLALYRETAGGENPGAPRQAGATEPNPC